MSGIRESEEETEIMSNLGSILGKRDGVRGPRAICLGIGSAFHLVGPSSGFDWASHADAEWTC